MIRRRTRLPVPSTASLKLKQRAPTRKENGNTPPNNSTVTIKVPSSSVSPGEEDNKPKSKQASLSNFVSNEMALTITTEGEENEGGSQESCNNYEGGDDDGFMSNNSGVPCSAGNHDYQMRKYGQQAVRQFTGARYGAGFNGSTNFMNGNTGVGFSRSGVSATGRYSTGP